MNLELASRIEQKDYRLMKSLEKERGVLENRKEKISKERADRMDWAIASFKVFLDSGKEKERWNSFKEMEVYYNYLNNNLSDEKIDRKFVGKLHETLEHLELNYVERWKKQKDQHQS